MQLPWTVSDQWARHAFGSEARMGQTSVADHFPAHRQQTGHETIWVQEGSHSGESQAKGRRSLDHSSVFQFQVSMIEIQMDFSHKFDLNYFKILLGLVHASAIGGQSDHSSSGHFLLQ